MFYLGTELISRPEQHKYPFIHLSSVSALIRLVVDPDPGNNGCEVGIHPGWETSLSRSTTHLQDHAGLI